jgi:5,10-methylenetetrahydromethanopterin reductase
VAMYLEVVASLDPTVRLPAGLLEHVEGRLAAGDPEGAGRAVPEDVLDRFALSGTPEQVAAQAAGLFDAGATRVEFGTPHGLTAARGVDLIGTRVMPLLGIGPGGRAEPAGSPAR